MSSAGFCQFDAGILGADDKLTQVAKTKFIQDLKKELAKMLGGLAILAPLEDEKKFAEFHKNVFGQYAQIAKMLDAQSRFTLLPICDPAALAVSLGAEVPKLKFPAEFLIYGFAPPLLALKLQFTLPTDLLAKLPPLIALPIPSLTIPKVDIDPRLFPELLSFSAGVAGVPPKILNVLIELVTKMPQLAVGIITLQLDPIFDAVIASKMFGDFDPNTALTWVAAQKVLAQKVGECILINLVGTTMGSSSGGLVGGLAQALGYVPPPAKFGVQSSPADKIVKAAKVAVGQSWSADQELVAKTPPDKLNLKYTGLLLPIEVDDASGAKVLAAHRKAQTLDCGTLLARTCLLQAGLTDDFFIKPYVEQGAAAKLRSIALEKKLIATEYSMEKGDIVILETGATAVSLDTFRNGSGSVVISQLDSGNSNLPTAMKKYDAKLLGSALVINQTSLQISYVIQGKKLVE